ncbi:MAG: hypothetical protein DWQ01_15960 [Planctomycetota bacterium]|nr:MAG: hypothetical protein DWQ01_15960 [Planctomycetota bacterium]
MRFQFFTIPVFGGEEATQALNRFLASHRILSVDRELIQDGAASAWTVCVSYLLGGPDPTPSRKNKVDYREVLSEKDFKIFARLRELRKVVAHQEGVPAYHVFTNEQLAQMVRNRVQSLQAMAEVEGVGPARLEKYGVSFLSVLTQPEPVSHNADQSG